MENQMILLFAVIIGLSLGALICWLILRSQIAAAVEKGKTEAQVELATGKERLRSTEEELRHSQSEQEKIQQMANRLRDEVTVANNEKAQLNERASRVPALENELLKADALEKESQEDILRLSTSEAEKMQLLQSTKNRLTEVEAEQTATQRLLDSTLTAHNEVSEKYAALEVKASRIAALEQNIADKDAAVTSLNREMASLKEDAGRLQAELKAEQDTNAATDIRYVSLQQNITAKEVALTSLNREVASLKEDAGRLQAELKAEHDMNTATDLRYASLQQNVAAKEVVLSLLNREVASLKEDTGRLQAELKAEQDTNAATDERHATLQQKMMDTEKDLITSRQQTSVHGATIGRLEAELAAERTGLATALEELSAEKAFCDLAKKDANRLMTELAEITVHLEAERGQNAEKIELLTQAREQMSLEFKNLANEILEDKSKRFTEHNQANIGQLINPLKEKMTEFKTKVEEIHANDIEQQAMLRSELSQLKDLNRQITEEAHGLATALKGHAKTQGNWGELVLGNVLDRAGLCEGKDFRREVSFNTEEGRKRPDVVVSLPQNKHLVIDAKVSLNAYTRYINAVDDGDRDQALKEHVQAISCRIQELSDRSYFDLPGLNTPEMVFMFIPIESAFVEALRADENLFQHAIANNILVATPTTLLTSLNIVRQLWRFEEQNLHTAELADRAGKVYKKLVSFLVSMEAVGMQLDKAKDSYGKAMGQLVHGRGNLIQQANDFERLGVSIQTPIPSHLVDKAVLELNHVARLDGDLAAPLQ